MPNKFFLNFGRSSSMFITLTTYSSVSPVLPNSLGLDLEICILVHSPSDMDIGFCWRITRLPAKRCWVNVFGSQQFPHLVLNKLSPCQEERVHIQCLLDCVLQ